MIVCSKKKHVDFPIMEYYSDEDFPLDMMERMKIVLKLSILIKTLKAAVSRMKLV